MHARNQCAPNKNIKYIPALPSALQAAAMTALGAICIKKRHFSTASVHKPPPNVQSASCNHVFCTAHPARPTWAPDGEHKTQKGVCGCAVQRQRGGSGFASREWPSMAFAVQWIFRTNTNWPGKSALNKSFSLVPTVGHSRSVSRDRRRWGGRAERVVHGPSSASQVGTPVGHRGSCGGVGEPCDCGGKDRREKRERLSEKILRLALLTF